MVARDWIGHRITPLTRPEQNRAASLGRLIMRPWLYFVVAVLLASSRVAAACIDPSTLVHSTVSIKRIFADEEIKSDPKVLGISGTGWFLAPGSMATIGHVAEAMHLSGDDWKDVEIRDGQNIRSIAVRILRFVGSQPERIAVLELRSPLPGAQVLQIRTRPLVADERVMSLAYPHDRLRFAGGRFVEYGADEGVTGTALLELYDGTDRLVLDHGASGAPVLDCEGRVAAIVSNILTQTIQFAWSAIRTSTAWQRPNVVSVPVQALKEITQAD
jgi:hypothetical protein